MVAWTVDRIGIDSVAIGTDYCPGHSRMVRTWWRYARWSRESAPEKEMVIAPHEGWSDWIKSPADLPNIGQGLGAAGFAGGGDREDHGRQLAAPVRPDDRARSLIAAGDVRGLAPVRLPRTIPAYEPWTECRSTSRRASSSSSSGLPAAARRRSLRMIAGFIEPSAGPHPDRWPGRHLAAAPASRHRNGVPELRSFPDDERRGEYRLRAEAARGDRGQPSEARVSELIELVATRRPRQ